MLKDRIDIETKKKYWKMRTKFLNIFRKIIRYMRKPPKWKRIYIRIRIRKHLGKDREIKKRNSRCRHNFLENLMPVLDAMPVSNGSRYYDKQNVRIAIVADEFLYDSFKDIAEFIYVKPDTYQDYIGKVDFFLVASAWRGLNNEWRVMATEGTDNNRIIHEAIDAYRQAGTAVVFYSKEDPPNYEHFLPIAKKCDIIFTSCAEKVEDYKKDCNNEKVYVMEFCVNPVFHNPIGICNSKRTEGVFFAGSWMLKYPDRCRALEIMLDGVLESGKDLVIADRNFSQDNITYFFPPKYYPYITKEIPHDYLQKVHKLYQWAININSITDSKTMFANRVYELQANGCLMISNRSVGVEEKFKEVIIVNIKDDVKTALKRYDKEEIYEHQITAVRRVMTGETNYDRIMKLLSAVGIESKAMERSILAVAEQITPQVLEMFEAQTYPYKKLVALAELTEELYDAYDIVARWDDESIYGIYYLEDMINGFKYTSCDYIAKDCYLNHGRLTGKIEHDYVEQVANIYAAVFWRSTIAMKTFLSIENETMLQNGYSIDHFNYEKR